MCFVFSPVEVYTTHTRTCMYNVDLHIHVLFSRSYTTYTCMYNVHIHVAFSQVDNVCTHSHVQWAIPFNIHTTPTEDMVIMSQGVIQTSTVLGGTVSYFVASREVNSTVPVGKLLR